MGAEGEGLSLTTPRTVSPATDAVAESGEVLVAAARDSPSDPGITAALWDS